MEFEHRHHVTHLLVVAVAAAVFIFLYGRITPEAAIWNTSPDIHAYRIMAQAFPGLADTIAAPYSYRILAPYIAGALPLSVPDAYYLCSIVVAFFLPLLFYEFLCASGVHSAAAAFTAILYIMNRHIYGMAVWEYFRLDDLLTFAALVGLFWTLRLRRWLWFSFILIIGVLTRETALLMIPTAFVYILEQKTLTRDFWRLVIASTMPVAVSICVRQFVVSTGGTTLAESFLDSVPKLALPETWFRQLVNAFIPLSFLPFVFWRQTARFFHERMHMLAFVLLVFASAQFGGDDERLIAPVFVSVYLLYGVIIQELFLSNAAALAVLLGCGVLTTWNHLFARYPIPRPATILLSFVATAVATIFMIWGEYFSNKKIRPRDTGAK